MMRNRSTLTLAVPVLSLALTWAVLRAASPSAPPAASDAPPATQAAATAPAEEGFLPLFNGKDLSGWDGDANLWSVKDATIIGRSPGIKYNDFLATTKEYGDFILRLEMKLVDGKGNTGVQFRSKREPKSPQVRGYQADFATNYWGKLYDEGRRGRFLGLPQGEDLRKLDEKLKAVAKPQDWNQYEISAVGAKVTLTFNGVKTIEYDEADEKIARTGIVALQIHGGGPMEVRFRNVRIKELPAATTKPER